MTSNFDARVSPTSIQACVPSRKRIKFGAAALLILAGLATSPVTLAQFPYAGTYSGTYTGQVTKCVNSTFTCSNVPDSGSWGVTIDSNGRVTSAFFSDSLVGSIPYFADSGGANIGGQFHADFATPDRVQNASLDGVINASDGTVTGYAHFNWYYSNGDSYSSDYLAGSGLTITGRGGTSTPTPTPCTSVAVTPIKQCATFLAENADLLDDLTDPTHTIGRKGCLLTAYTMLINTLAPAGTPLIIPSDLNNYLRDPQRPQGLGFDGKTGKIWPQGIVKYASDHGFSLTFKQMAPNNALLDNYLCSGLPVVLQVHRPGHPISHTHFVLAVGKGTTSTGAPTYEIVDPDNCGGSIANDTTLEAYGNTYDGIRLFTPAGASPYKNELAEPASNASRSSNSVAELEITADSAAVELLLADPSGNQTGVTSTAGTAVQNIAESTYATEALEDDDDYTSTLPETKTLHVANPPTGVYSLQVFGVGSGPFSVTVVQYDANGVANLQTITGVAAPGSTTTYSISLPASNPSQLVNISTRGLVLTGENVLDAGFILRGTEPKKLLITAQGMSLTPAGVPGVLADPVLALHDQDSKALLMTNDNWGDAENASAILDAATSHGFTLAPTDAAILTTLSPNQNGYTAILYGQNGGTGIALVGVFDLSPSSSSTLINISTRGFVGPGAAVMIPGFITQGTPQNQIKVLVVGYGPSLSQAGVAGVLQDPSLILFTVNGDKLGCNDNWTGLQNTCTQTPDSAAISATGLAPTDPREPAMLVTLPPGAYTPQLIGENGTTGVALVGVFVVQ